MLSWLLSPFKDHKSQRARDAAKHYAGRLSQELLNKDLRGQEFITEKILRDFWTDNELAKAASEMELPFGGDKINFVKKHLIRTFSILVKILWDEWEKFPGLFLHGKLGTTDDQVMSLSREKLEESLGPAWGLNFYTSIPIFNPINITEGQVITSRKKDMNNGENAERKKYVDEPRGIRLPFCLDKDGRMLGAGASGTVTEVTIAAGQYIDKHGHPNDAPKLLARKCFRSEIGYSKETVISNYLSNSFRRHDHIRVPIAMISLKTEYSHLLEAADCNLKEFLGNDGEMDDDITLESLLGQVEGLADALSFLQDSGSGTGAIIYHTDLKLDNFVVMRQAECKGVGRWMITDFGHSRHHQADSGRGPSGSAYDRAGVFQASRQGEHLAPDSEYGPYSDVWSLGCILARVVCRKRRGIDGLRRFDESLRLDDPDGNDYFYRGNDINPQVEKLLGDFSKAECEMTKECGALLKHVLSIDRDSRPTAKGFKAELQRIRQKHQPTTNPQGESPPTTESLNPQEEFPPTTASLNPPWSVLPCQRRSLDQDDILDAESDGQGPSQHRPRAAVAVEPPRGGATIARVNPQRSSSTNSQCSDSTDSVRLAINQDVEDNAMTQLKGLFSGSITTYSELDSYSAGPALCHAAKQGYPEVVQFLIEKGAQVDERDSRNNTPLMHACREGHSSTAEILIGHGADWNLQGEDRNTCLHFATENRRTEILELFQRKQRGKGSLNANQLNRLDRTPLELHLNRTGERDRQILIRHLLDLGADAKASFPGREHQTAVDLVLAADDVKAMEVLLKWGSTPTVVKADLRRSGKRPSRDMKKLLREYNGLQ
ncbi:uncharacterized protein BJX67DRAFT_376218 [Aspergillus lucknowensis]|uniref:Protein kinase domain-containing protein n=1 Tax=Aspergillus lucknowensis TaxID=176173 RepID=A0ABR4M774_9EURO